MIGKAVKAFLSLFFAIFLLIIIMIIPFICLSGKGAGTGSGNVGTGASGQNWTTNPDVSMNGVRDTTLNGLQDLADWYKEHTGEDLLVTSGTDGDMHAVAQRGSHYSGDKLDVASDALENEEFRQQFIDYANSKGIKVLDEYANPSANSTGGHLDLDFTGYNGKSAFSGFGSQSGKASYI